MVMSSPNHLTPVDILSHFSFSFSKEETMLMGFNYGMKDASWIFGFFHSSLAVDQLPREILSFPLLAEFKQ